ncbi:transposase family protein [Streptomyces sp. NPDC056817]|uniref:transposase family protein n=1 Tax=Streptomyces sp. NPDC056817 TaxID=3345950 RepID=UPI003691F9CD
MLEELAPKWEATRESALCERRGGARRRAVGAGRKQRLVFADRLLATLVCLRLGLPHAALAELFEVDRSTVSAAIREVRPLLAARGLAVPDRPGLRIRTLTRPGRMHDQTAVRAEGIAEQFRLQPTVKAKVDSGYQGLAKEFPDQVSAPPKKPADDACEGDKRAWRETRRRQSSQRIVVEHANAEYKQWHPLQRYTGRREDYDQTHRAIAGLVSDRSARRATRRTASTELVLVRTTAC